MRDVLLGAVPPATMRSARYVTIAMIATVVVIAMRSWVQLVPSWLLVGMDAVGLALFAVAGTEKALLHEVHPIVAVMLGAVSAVGGGVLRDVFVDRVPAILLASDIYAVAALLGASVVVLAQRARMRPELAALLGGVACFTLRIVAVWQGWSLPQAG